MNFRFFVKIFKKGFLQLDFLSHGKYTGTVEVEDALYERICTYAEQHQLTVTEVVLQGLDKVLSDFE